MNNKLYKVKVEFDLYVLAEDEKEAERVANFNASDELGNGLASYYFQECKNIEEIPEDARNSLPYASHWIKEERTLEEILAISTKNES
jgi:hypothetical protein